MSSRSDRMRMACVLAAIGCSGASSTPTPHAGATTASQASQSPALAVVNPAAPGPSLSLLQQAAMMGPTHVDGVALAPMSATWQDHHVLRICADPNNLPFSNRAGEGFENKIAEMIAQDIGATVAYTWWPQRRGFARTTLRHGLCDVIMGVPADYELASVTAPYYRSAYVFVTRRDRGLHIRSLDDPVLKQLRIGVHTIGDDYANTPPAEALARRGVTGQLVGYPIYGDYSKPNPPANILRAVARDDVDVAIVWGPTAGYFASRVGPALQLAAVTPDSDPPALQFAFDIAAGVRRGDTATRTMLDNELSRRSGDIHRLLAGYHIPYTVPVPRPHNHVEGR